MGRRTCWAAGGHVAQKVNKSAHSISSAQGASLLSLLPISGFSRCDSIVFHTDLLEPSSNEMRSCNAARVCRVKASRTLEPRRPFRASLFFYGENNFTRLCFCLPCLRCLQPTALQWVHSKMGRRGGRAADRHPPQRGCGTGPCAGV